jgi:ATP/maltotriose-dependent transcriptional regulator MalT
LLALGQGISQARKDLDTAGQETYLLQAIQVATELQSHIQRIHWMAVLGNFYLRQGHPDKAMKWLQQSVQLSIVHEHHLVTVAQGTILSGLWFGRGEIDRVSALSLSIEDAALQRHNWLAFATTRNTRASCLLIRKNEIEAIKLLLETGDFLYAKGAVAALNIVKARLGEFQLLLGQDRIRTIIDELKQAI